MSSAARGHELIDWIADHVEGLERRRVRAGRRSPATCGPGCPSTRRPSPSRGRPSAATSTRSSCPGIVHWQHPSFFAYFPSNTSYPSILGELLAAGLGVQGMSWVTSPACTELETLMLDWMAELLDLPDRVPLDERRRRRRDPGLGQRGHARGHPVGPLAGDGAAPSTRDGDTTRLVAYASSQAHSSIEKGLRIAGIGTDRTRIVAPRPARSRCDPAALAAMVDADRGGRAGAVLRVRVRAARRRRWRSTRPPAIADGVPASAACGCTSTRR